MLIESGLTPRWTKFIRLAIHLFRIFFLSKAFLSTVFFFAIITMASQAPAELVDDRQIAQQSPACSETELERMLSQWRRLYLPVVSELRACGDSAVPGLVEAMADESLELRVRQFSARILAQTGSEEAVNALLNSSRDDALQSGVYQAVRSLNPDSPAVSILLEGLTTSEPSVATTAAIGLAQIASPEAVGGLLAALRNEATQEVAFLGLGEINPDSEIAVEVLTAALESESEIVQVGAAHGLAEIGPNAEASISKLAELLRLSEWEYFHQGSDVRGMAAYALGQINPLHEQALKALGVTVSFYEPEVIETTRYYPEPSEEVKEIAAEALDGIDNILPLLNWNAESQRWHYIALGYQSGSELLEAFDKILLETNADPEIILRAIEVTSSFPTDSFVESGNHHISFPNFFNYLLPIIENKDINIETRHEAFRIIFEHYLFSPHYRLSTVDESVISRLIQVVEDEGEEFEIRHAALALIVHLFIYDVNYNVDADRQKVAEALIKIVESSHLYSLWKEDYEQLQRQGVINWDDIRNDIGTV
ncbi:MAG TPA: hypothetical protein VEZ50_06410, partial [Nodosilinea sp.]|nr:hypothetical protein [Nodosilinea sp.]